MYCIHDSHTIPYFLILKQTPTAFFRLPDMQVAGGRPSRMCSSMRPRGPQRMGTRPLGAVGDRA